MQDFITYLLKFPQFFLWLLLGYYLVPAGLSYLYFFVWKKGANEKRRIQTRRPSKYSIYREIRWSVLSVLIFSILTLILFYFVESGHTKVYFEPDAYGWGYLILSPVLCMVLHDTYFYWTHRFMHWRPIFRWVHAVHHRSNPPTPWAILSFGPLECLILYGFYALVAFFIPIHPGAAAVFICYNIILNTGGHLGYEIVPESFSSNKFLRHGLTVRHHDMHHSKGNCNYGLYFNFWDRIMGTNHNKYEQLLMKARGK